MSEKLTIKQGEAKTITFTVKDALGAAVNLSAATLTLGVKRVKSDEAFSIYKEDADFDKTQAASGIVTVVLNSTDTDLPEKTSPYIGELVCSWVGPPETINKSADFFLQIEASVT